MKNEKLTSYIIEDGKKIKAPVDFIINSTVVTALNFNMAPGKGKEIYNYMQENIPFDKENFIISNIDAWMHNEEIYVKYKLQRKGFIRLGDRGAETK